jgi:hypothetical protein
MLIIRVGLDSLFISLPRQFFLSLLLVNVAQGVIKRGAFRMQFYGDFEQGQRVINPFLTCPIARRLIQCPGAGKSVWVEGQ